MKRFRWNENLGFGLRVIDRDHRQLIDLLNRVHSVAVDGPGHEVIATAIDDLADYVAHHFRYEEMLMRLSGYPGYEAHRQLHQYLTDRIAKFQARFRADPATFSVDKLYEFLAKWLQVHIMREDMKIRPYVESLAQAKVACSAEGKTPPLQSASNAKLYAPKGAEDGYADRVIAHGVGQVAKMDWPARARERA